MTVPSTLSEIIPTSPDDDGTSIDDDEFAPPPTAPAETSRDPEPLRSIEYLLLRNLRLEDSICQKFERTQNTKDELSWFYDTDEGKEFDRFDNICSKLFGLTVIVHWSDVEKTSDHSKRSFQWQRPFVAMALAIDGLPFSTEEEMVEYIAALPPHGRADYGWRVRRITTDRGDAVRYDEFWAEMKEHPNTVSRDQVRYLVHDISTWVDDEPVPREVIAFEEFVRSRQPKDLADRISRWHMAGRNLELYKRLGRRRDRAAGAEKVEMLVEELVPAGMVTLMAGAQEAGKSTAAAELAVSIVTGQDEWLGRKILRERAKGIAVLLSGEDTEAVINSRLARLDPLDEAARLVVYALDGRSLEDITAEIGMMPAVSLIVVDPARRYLRGDEDSSANVDGFFAALDDIARRTGAAVLVLHHLRKDANVTSLQQVRETIRGSGVFIDRPRVVLGCLRLKRADETVIGVIKSNLPPEYPIAAAIKLRRDAGTLRHIPIEVKAVAEVDRGAETDELERKVLDAIIRLSGQGERMTRAGSRELWSLHPPELLGVGRNRIRAVVDKLLEDGLLMLRDQSIVLTP